MMKLSLLIDYLFRLEYFISLIFIIQLDILIGAFLGVKYARYGSWVEIVNFLISMLVIIFYRVLAGRLCSVIYKINKTMNEGVV